jgi:superfamily II DNA or RNA helicase
MVEAWSMSSEIQLRPYQQAAIDEARKKIIAGKNRFVFCSPTGSGKTFTFSFIVQSAINKNKRVLILTHRLELMTQAGGSLDKLGVKVTNIEAGKNITYFNQNLYTAMIETISRRMEKEQYQRFVESLDMVIIDECHIGSFDKFFQYLSNNCVVIGFTATPHREGNQKCLSQMYEDIVEVISIPELIRQGYLAKPKSFGVEIDMSKVKMKGKDYDSEEMGNYFTDQKLWEGVIENYNRICPNTKALIFCPSIKSSMVMTAQLVNEGLNAKHLDGETPKHERRMILKWFKDTPNAILCNVGVLTTGFDEPSVQTIILYRATKSLPLFLQMVGRGSRVIPNLKEEFTILDFGNNIREHGFWEDERVWKLKKKEKKKKGAIPAKTCKSCGALVPPSLRVCSHCDEPFEVKEAGKPRQFAMLHQLNPTQVRSFASRASLEEKASMAKEGLIKPAWVLHNLTDRKEAEYFVKLMGYKKGWYFHNQKRFKVFQL